MRWWHKKNKIKIKIKIKIKVKIKVKIKIKIKIKKNMAAWTEKQRISWTENVIKTEEQ